MLLGLILVVEDGVGEPAIAFHAAHGLDLLEDQIEVGVELWIAKHEGTVLRALVDNFLHRRIDVVLSELFGAGRGGAGGGVGRRGRFGGF